jgi:tetratricopeptide (TPR) repeat protein
MPIISISSSDASRNLRRNPTSVWPDGRKRGWRLEGIATIEPKPSFTFTPDDLIMTMGSCFAREIENALTRLGFDLPACGVEIPRDERVSSVANDILNKYTVQSMANEIEWAFSPPNVADEDLFVTAGDGLWHDPHLVHTLKPASLERVAERRAMVLNTMRRLPECRVIVVTLGLAEAWFDQKLGVYLNSAPPQPAITAEPDRFRLDVLSYDDISKGIDRLLALFKRYGHREHKVLMTVSPVPFNATFTGKDALAANTYSKAVQRAAVEAAVERYDNVDYFPSYEIVTLTDRKTAFHLDNIHVNPEIVSEIMRRVVQAYVPGIEVEAAESLDLMRNSREEFDYPAIIGFGHAAIERRDYVLAASHFSGILYRFADALPPSYMSAAYAGLVQTMQLANRFEEALRHAEMWRAADPKNALAAATMSKILWRLDQREAALEMAQLACELEPGDAVLHLRWASLLIRQNQREQARAVALRAIELDPGLDGAQEILDKTEAGALSDAAE